MYQHGGDIYSNKNSIDFSANINPFGMPESVRLAAREAIDAAVHYPDVSCGALKTAISQRDQVPEEWLICGNGAADVIFSLVHAKKPRKALLPIPSFYEYQQALESVSCEIATYLLSEEQGFCLDEGILPAIQPDIDMVFICNPNNPTGVLTQRALLERILKQCEQMDTLLVLDECFMDFIAEEKSFSMMEKIKNSRHLFILKAFTKMYAMPGLRLGYGVSSNQQLLEQMGRVTQPWRVSVPAQAAGIAATKEMTFVKKSQEYIQKQRCYVMEELRQMGYLVYASSANFIFFKASNQWGQGDPNLANELKEKGILIRDCSNYLGLGSGYYRVAVKSEKENQTLLQCLERRI